MNFSIHQCSVVRHDPKCGPTHVQAADAISQWVQNEKNASSKEIVFDEKLEEWAEFVGKYSSHLYKTLGLDETNDRARMVHLHRHAILDLLANRQYTNGTHIYPMDVRITAKLWRWRNPINPADKLPKWFFHEDKITLKIKKAAWTRYHTLDQTGSYEGIDEAIEKELGISLTKEDVREKVIVAEKLFAEYDKDCKHLARQLADFNLDERSMDGWSKTAIDTLVWKWRTWCSLEKIQDALKYELEQNLEQLKGEPVRRRLGCTLSSVDLHVTSAQAALSPPESSLTVATVAAGSLALGFVAYKISQFWRSLKIHDSEVSDCEDLEDST